MSLGTFSGRLKSFHDDKGYGFIECADLKAQGYKDAFLQLPQLNGASVGDEVTFTAYLGNRGLPQAENVVVTRGNQPPAAGGAYGGASAMGFGMHFQQPSNAHADFLQMAQAAQAAQMAQLAQIQMAYGAQLQMAGQLDPSSLMDMQAQQAYAQALAVAQAQASQEQAHAVAAEAAKQQAMAEGAIVTLGLSSDCVPAASACRGQVVGHFKGRVKHFNPEKGYGFIESSEMKAIGYVKDCFLHRKQLGSFQVGDLVSFEAYINDNGQPQSRDLELLEAGTAEDKVESADGKVSLISAGDPSGGGQEIGSFIGVVKSYNKEGGYGFISCEALRAYGYHNDCFVHHQQLRACQAGDTVSFIAYVNGGKGQLRAKNLEMLSRSYSSPPSHSEVSALTNSAQVSDTSDKRPAEESFSEETGERVKRLRGADERLSV